jgi:hypothetical protein
MAARSTRSRLLRRLAVAALALAGLACAGPAAAAFTPKPAVDLFSGDLVLGVQVAASRQGDAVVGWTGQNNQPTVFAAFRPGKGPFAPLEILSSKANGSNPDVVFEPDGTALTLWGHATVADVGGWARRPRTAPFSPTQSLPLIEGTNEVGIDGSGTALAVGKAVTMGMNFVAASRRPLGGAFEAPVPLSAPTLDSGIAPDVAVNASGEAAAAWRRTSAPSEGAIEARIGSTAVPSFEGLQLLASEASEEEALSEPDVAIAPSGEAIAVWSRTVSGVTTIWYAVRPPGGAGFGSPQPLAPGAPGARVEMDPASGTAVIGLAHGPPGGLAPGAVVRPPGGDVGPIVPLAPPVPPGGQVGIASVGFDSSGAALVAWSRFVSADVRLAEASRRSPGGAFGPAALIASMGPGGSALSVASERDGDAVAAWRVAIPTTPQILRVGGLAFTPDPQAAGPGAAAGALPRICAGRRVTIVGTPRADRIRGTARRDVIAALGGNDVVRGLGGADVVCGGAGRDTLLGGPGRDLLRGEAGADLLRGGAGRDRMLGGAGRDRLLGGLGRDALLGGPGRDAQVQ